MGCGASNNIVSGIPSEETIINNKYNYLKNCLDEYIYNSGKEKSFVNPFCGSENQYDKYENSSLKRLIETGGIKSVYDIIELLCYLPFDEDYPRGYIEPTNVFMSYVIKFKKNSIGSFAENTKTTMFYKTNHMIAWKTFKVVSNSYEYYHIEDYYQQHYIKQTFKTICAIIDIVNIECNLFTNEEWISKDFINMVNNFKFVKPHTKLLQKINEWIINKNKYYKNKIDTTMKTIKALNQEFEDTMNREEIRKTSLNNSSNLDYSLIGNLIASENFTFDEEIKRIKYGLNKYEDVLKIRKKRLECTESLLKIIVINSDEPNKPVIKQEKPIASAVYDVENTDIPMAEAVVIN